MPTTAKADYSTASARFGVCVGKKRGFSTNKEEIVTSVGLQQNTNISNEMLQKTLMIYILS